MTDARVLVDPASVAGRELVVCGDVGSTFTKLLAVDTAAGALVATAAHRTTVGTDVLDGVDAAAGALAGALPGAVLGEPRLCSSAGGGLRLAVVGYEALVTAEAGHRVGLSAGARVEHVAAGMLDGAGVTALRAARPDVVLLVGGTDGGDSAVLTHNARRLAATRLRVPVVVAGNADATGEVVALLAGRGVPVTAAGNVLPRIGELRPDSARAAIRQVFLRHVIGGKKLSRSARFAGLVRGATPDVVLSAVEFLADTGAGELLVLDVGGATTDVYSALAPAGVGLDGPAGTPGHEVAGTLWRSRTVEGDLGVRWNAPGIVAAATAEKLLPAAEADTLGPAADERAADPGRTAETGAERAIDARLAELAATVALRRHARGDRGPDGVRRGLKDLRRVRLVIGSGGVLRHAPATVARTLLTAATTDHAGGYPLPARAAHRVDRRYLLAAVGLLSADHPDAASALAARGLTGPSGG